MLGFWICTIKNIKNRKGQMHAHKTGRKHGKYLERDTHPVGAEIVAAADPRRTACRESIEE